MSTSSTRRIFLGSLGAAAVGARAIYGYPANETINVACIGTGGRCRTLMKSLATIPNVRLAAVCDIYDLHREEGRKLSDPKCAVSKNYKELLDSKDYEAVLIGSPDHWHAPMTLDALAAGKDIYVEKPLTHKMREGKPLLEAQAKHQRIVQVGTQQRSMPHIQKGFELYRDGRLGKVHKVHLTWNRNSDRVRKVKRGIDPKQVDWKAFLGNAPDQPFDDYKLVGQWRWFWDFGGGLFTDLMVHWIDVAHWILDLDHPLKAVALGQHTVSKDVWETPDTVQTILTYPNEIQAHFEGTFSNAREGAHIVFMGTDASLYIDRGRFELIPERGKGKAEEMILGSGPKGRDFYEKPDGEKLHLENWVSSMRSRKPTSAPLEAGVRAAASAHLSNQALRSGQTAEWKE